MSKDLIRTKDSVFVQVKPPESLQRVIEAKRQAKVWTKVATAIATETAEAIPAPKPAVIEPKPKKASGAPLGDPTDVRIYRRESSGKQTKIWEGSAPHNIDAWCQSQADQSGCLITMHDAESVKHFHPENPIVNDDAPPISDKVKSEAQPKPSTYLQDLLAEVDRIMGVHHA